MDGTVLGFAELFHLHLPLGVGIACPEGFVVFLFLSICPSVHIQKKATAHVLAELQDGELKCKSFLKQTELCLCRPSP